MADKLSKIENDLKNPILDKLVQEKDLLSYQYYNIDDEFGHPGSRDTEKLILKLPSGKSLILETFCSGSSQNTILMISLDETELLARETARLKHRQQRIAQGRCMADSDGDCDWEGCPQLSNRQATCIRWVQTHQDDE